MLKQSMSGAWWLVLVRGLIAIVFGILVVLNTLGMTLALFVAFALFAIVDGIIQIYTALSTRKSSDRWWQPLIAGLASLLAGALAFTWPELTLLILAFFIAVRAIIHGISEILLARRLWQEHAEWLLLIGGLLSILFGLWMGFHPLVGGLALVWVIGIYGIVVGAILILESFNIRSGGTAGGGTPAPA